jgi:hypothetical protein
MSSNSSCYLSFNPANPPVQLLTETLQKRQRLNCEKSKGPAKNRRNHPAILKGKRNNAFATQGELYSFNNVNNLKLENSELAYFYNNTLTQLDINSATTLTQCQQPLVPVYNSLPYSSSSSTT